MSGTATCDALVIGGGLAGSALAISLSRAGRCVTLVEKSKAAHPKVCGEFLSHEALHYLAQLGLDRECLQQLGAVPIEAVRLAGDRVLASATLPFAAASLSRECLDEVLLRCAGESGAAVHRGDRAQALARDGEAWQVTTANGIGFRSKAAFLATGKHDMHGMPRPAGSHKGLLAFKMYWRLVPEQQAELARHVELILFPGGYAGLQPVEHGLANLCLLIDGGMYRRVGGSWAALVAHMQAHARHLGERLAGATAWWERPLSLSSIPYGYVRSESPDELWRLGDQSAVIPSFAGDGMSIALHSAHLAARVYAGGQPAAVYQARFAQDVSRQVKLATLLSRALVHTPLLLKMVAVSWPSLLPTIARSTRIPQRRLLDESL